MHISNALRPHPQMHRHPNGPGQRPEGPERGQDQAVERAAAQARRRPGVVASTRLQEARETMEALKARHQAQRAKAAAAGGEEEVRSDALRTARRGDGLAARPGVEVFGRRGDGLSARPGIEVYGEAQPLGETAEAEEAVQPHRFLKRVAREVRSVLKELRQLEVRADDAMGDGRAGEIHALAKDFRHALRDLHRGMRQGTLDRGDLVEGLGTAFGALESGLKALYGAGETDPVDNAAAEAVANGAADAANAAAKVANAPAEVANAPAEVANAPDEVANAPAEVANAPAEVANAPAVEEAAGLNAPVVNAPVMEASRPEAPAEERPGRGVRRLRKLLASLSDTLESRLAQFRSAMAEGQGTEESAEAGRFERARSVMAEIRSALADDSRSRGGLNRIG